MARWGIMATGAIASRFADTINHMDGEAVLGAVASRDIKKAENFAKEYYARSFYGSYEELCQSDQVDIIYIATPNSMHYENVMLCLENGKHVLCEKPFTLHVSEAEKLYRAAREKNLFLMDGFWITHLPLLKKLVQIIDGGEIGEVKHLRAEYGFVTDDMRRKRKLSKELGGGALLDIGIYNIGFAKMIMKDQPSVIKSSVCINEFGTDEFSVLLFEYPNGRTASLTTSIGMQMDLEAVIYGSKGKIYLPDYQKAEMMSIQKYGEKPYQVKMPFEVNGFEYQIREAEKCMENNKGVSSTMNERLSLDILETLETILQSWSVEYEKIY